MDTHDSGTLESLVAEQFCAPMSINSPYLYPMIHDLPPPDGQIDPSLDPLGRINAFADQIENRIGLPAVLDKQSVAVAVARFLSSHYGTSLHLRDCATIAAAIADRVLTTMMTSIDRCIRE